LYLILYKNIIYIYKQKLFIFNFVIIIITKIKLLLVFIIVKKNEMQVAFTNFINVNDLIIIKINN